MGRRVVIVLAVVALFVAAGAAFALLRDDGTSDTAGGTSTTSASSTTRTPSTSAAASTSAPTTAAPTTTLGSGAVPDACGVDSAAIEAAVNKGVDGASTRSQVDQCRLAAVDKTWAAVRLVAKPGADFAATTVVLHGGGGSWAIVGTGGTATVCNQAPQQVLVDLSIGCTSGGGGI